MPPFKKFIAWDWNGTLQDDMHVSMAAANHELRSLGKPTVDEERYRECFEVPIDRMYRNFGLNEEEISTCLNPLTNSFFSIYEKLIASVDFREGARDILDFGTSCGIAHVILSNHLKESVVRDLTRLQKLDSFHEILAWPSRDAQYKHPKGDFLEGYMRQNGFESQDGIVVGDTPEEVYAARQYGLVSIAISGGYNALSILEKAKPDYLVSSLQDIKPILQELGFAA